MKSLQGNTLQTPDAFINSYYESFQTGQLPYVNYGADDGLPQEDVFSIYQDKKGYIWFGTNSGAVRYNGREMFVFNESNGLNANTVRDVKQDTSGTIFLATNNGVSMLKRDTVIHIYFTGTSFKKILVDIKNNKWLIGEDGVYFLTNDMHEVSLNSMFPELPKLIYNITEDPKTGNVYLATSKGVFLINMEENTSLRINDKDCFSVFVDINDSIWISTKSGLYISDLKGLTNGSYKSEVFNLNHRLDFPIEIFTEIKTNNFGSVWLISDSRIYQVISTDQKPVLYEEEIGIRNNKILSFFADKEDNIWIGFSGGLQRLTNRKGLRNFFPNTINSFIYSIFEDESGRIWVNSNNGIYYFINELIQFHPPIGVSNQKFLAAPLKNGNILLANTFGVYEINGITLKVTRYSQFPQLSMSLENVYISSKGEIFLLTGINGVVYYLNDFYSQPIQLKNRNTSNIFQLTEYHDQVVGGNNTGIVSFDGNEFVSVLETDCNVWSLHASDTTLWIGTDCGLGRINNEYI
jgi:ligand-binding sensor domain-containing protein